MKKLNSIAEKVAFIPAPDTGSKVYYYIAQYPSVALEEDQKHPLLSFDIFKDLDKIEFYGILQFTSKLEVTEAEVMAAAKERGYENDILIPLQVLSADLNVFFTGFFDEPITLGSSIDNGNTCVFNTTFLEESKINLLSTLLKQDPPVAPIGLSYKIDYLVQLPPSKFEIDASYKQVYSYLETKFGFNFLVVKASFSNIYQELKEEKLIEVTIEDHSGDLDKLINEELTAMILTAFFKPTYVEPSVPEMKPQFGFYLTKTTYTDERMGSLSAKINLTTVVKRSIYPQANFNRFIANSCYDPDSIVVEHIMDNDFFDFRKIKVYLLEDYLYENVTSVTVYFEYDGKKRDPLRFTPEDREKEFNVPIAIVDGIKDYKVKYHINVGFYQEGLTESMVASEVQITEADKLFLNVQSVLAQYKFEIQPFPGFNWDWFSSVSIDFIAYNNEAPPVLIPKKFKLDASSSEIPFTLLLPESKDNHFRFEAAYTYEPITSTHLKGPIEQPVDQLIMPPLAAYPQRQLEIIQDYEWGNLLEAIAELSFEYEPGEKIQQTFLIKPTSPKTVFFSADQPNPEMKIIDIKLTQITKKGKYTDTYSTDKNTFTLPKNNNYVNAKIKSWK